MRIIDADALREALWERHDYIRANAELYADAEETADEISGVVSLLDEQPTAYDVEKVVEQLDNRISSLDSKNKICMDAGEFKAADKYADKMCEVIEIKEIVRKGGVK